MFIGGYRTTLCMHQMLTSTCNQNTSFEWTDKHTTGTDGFVWGSNEPDNVGYLQYYLVLYTGLGTMDDTAGLGNGAICGIQAGNF
ncbi:unnamed protein product [Caenorhabditis angaria]|uniref:C-type lectin domain-containing protein n=1 Tax=Caenorhabditis angaria TaxID=860376 RepID=A0A9P1N2D5_9PELO|nr:unnamed protein product [Caenorhabditis angaria]